MKRVGTGVKFGKERQGISLRRREERRSLPAMAGRGQAVTPWAAISWLTVGPCVLGMYPTAPPRASCMLREVSDLNARVGMLAL